MSLFTKKIKLIIGGTLAGLLLTLPILIYISQYCFCEPENPQIEILSISECSHKESCESDHKHRKEINTHLKYSSQNCTSNFVDQLVFREQKNDRFQNGTPYVFYLQVDIEPQINQTLLNSIKTDINIPHNRFIDIINRIQLLI